MSIAYLFLPSPAETRRECLSNSPAVTVARHKCSEPHERSYYTTSPTLMRVLSGRVHLHVGSYSQTLTPRTVALLPTGFVINEKLDFSSEVLLYFINDSTLAPLMKGLGRKASIPEGGFIDPLNVGLSMILVDLLEESRSEDPDTIYPICAALIELICEDQKHRKAFLTPSQINVIRSESNAKSSEGLLLFKAAKARELMERETSFTESARKLKVSPAALRREFTNVWMQDPATFASRLKRAKKQWQRKIGIAQ